ncbi:MAG: hypothetical protein P8Y78_07885 [Acidihalobacter sp.]|jgi:hypothetical protein
MKLLATILATVFSLTVNADTLKPFDFKVPPKSEQLRFSKTVCSFEGLVVPDNAVVYAAGGYAGRDTGFQIDQSGHAARQFDVAVNSPDRPVILILASYEPTIWNMGWSEGTKIVAVLVSGYHRQVITGQEKKTPVLISTHDNRGPCGYFYIRNSRNTVLNPTSRKLFGKSVDLVYAGDKSGRLVLGKPIDGSTRLVTAANGSPESFRDTSTPLAGQAGLDEALAKGLIRRATARDADAWVKAVSSRPSTLDEPPIAGKGVPKPRPPRLRNAYVVLKAFTYPAGLYGAHSATFFIAKGAPAPSGNPGHSVVYDFNTLSCKGPLCRSR